MVARTESNRRRKPFQGCLLTMLSGLESGQVHALVRLTESLLKPVWYGLGYFQPCNVPVLFPNPRGQHRGRHSLYLAMTTTLRSTMHGAGIEKDAASPLFFWTQSPEGLVSVEFVERNFYAAARNPQHTIV